MDMSGEYTIPAPRQKVWEALNDPEVLKQCIDGCHSLEKTSDTEFQAKVTAKVGPVKATFNGKVNLSDIDPPNGYTISGEGQGGVAGFAKGGAQVKLSGEGNETVLTYEANAEVGGKLASVGSRLVLGVAKKTADDFFSKFSDIVGGGGEAAETPAASDEAPAAAPEPEAAPAGQPKAGVSPAVWVVGAIVVIAVAAWLLGGG